MAEATATIPNDTELRAHAEALGLRLVAAASRIAVAESCTGGWLAKVLTDVPGSSVWFEQGFVTYSNEAKARTLGVSALVLDANGAVSEAVVREMADGARRAASTAAAIAISGVAGPGGGTPDKPVGLVWIAWSLGDSEWAERCVFAGDREAVRRQAVARAMLGLLAKLNDPA